MLLSCFFLFYETEINPQMQLLVLKHFLSAEETEVGCPSITKVL